MKLPTFTIATFAAMSLAAATELESHPPADFGQAVHDFDFCENVIVQSDYEDYINEAANILIALEAFRQEITRLTEDVEDLEECIEHNDWMIHENREAISDHNDEDLDDNGEEIRDQQYRLKRLQK